MNRLPETETLKLTLEYDGTGFFGWQIQPDARTVQGELQRCLDPLLKGIPHRLIGASRTDAGVHALGQTVSLHLERSLSVDLPSFRRSLNGMMADDVLVTAVKRVPAGFHARYSARSKTYVYRTLEGRSPLRRRFAWELPWTLDDGLLDASAGLLPGVHDFAPLAVKVKEGEGKLEVMEARWESVGDEHRFTIRANRFVYMLIRSLVGLMIRIATGKTDISVLSRALLGERPKIFMAPPQGLTLMNIEY
jgi:tRNA pseudouridine38-40 synthase